MDVASFVEAQLASTPAQVLEIGCGDGDLARAVARLGYGIVAIDPIGLVAIFVGLGTSGSAENRKRQAMLGILTGLCIAIGFIFLGKIVFAALGITVADFQVGPEREESSWARP